MRFAYSAIHGESRTVWACGDDGTPHAVTCRDPDSARRLVCEANDADAYLRKHGRFPPLLSASAADLIAKCD